MRFKLTTISLLLIFQLLNIGLVAEAQKLPNIQQAGVRAPLNIKIDGKANEWDGKFQAYNAATDIFYIISNDNHSLYLAVQTTNQVAIHKILKGGISFLIQKSSKKSSNGAIIINYPVYSNMTYPSFLMSRKGAPLPQFTPTQADSAMNAMNNMISKNSKFIRVIGVNGVDSLLSIYNNEGIKSAQLFDNQLNYTCEIAIPLKKLGLSTDDNNTFSYQISLNAGPNKSTPMTIQLGRPANATPEAMAALERTQAVTNNAELLLHSTTDFWGVYKLVK